MPILKHRQQNRWLVSVIAISGMSRGGICQVAKYAKSASLNRRTNQQLSAENGFLKAMGRLFVGIVPRLQKNGGYSEFMAPVNTLAYPKHENAYKRKYERF